MAVRQNAPSVLTSNDVSLRMNGILLLATPAQDDRCVVGPGLPLGRLPNSIEVYKNPVQRLTRGEAQGIRLLRSMSGSDDV
jgi:hypothetical protein